MHGTVAHKYIYEVLRWKSVFIEHVLPRENQVGFIFQTICQQNVNEVETSVVRPIL